MLLVFGAPCQHLTLAGLEHGRTIPLADQTFAMAIAKTLRCIIDPRGAAQCVSAQKSPDIRHCTPPTRFGTGFHKFPRALNESIDGRAESPMFQSDDPGGYLDA